MSLTERLYDSALLLGVRLNEAQLDACEKLLDELNEWNQRLNLTAIRDPEQQLTKHLLDSFSIQNFLRGTRIADIGTGAGFPGLPLALINPDRQFVLVDSINKKLRFVEHVSQIMALKNVSVMHVRAETYKPELRFDCVISRALTSLENFVSWCGHLCTPDGRLLAMKGRYPEDELKTVLAGWKVQAVHSLQVPGLNEQRNLVELCHAGRKRT